MSDKIALIVGAGPAGLTAAYELVTRTDIKPIIFEADIQVGGISKTVNYKGNRIDIGGHRFFSKSDRVMNWWAKVLPLEAGVGEGAESITVSYQNKSREIDARQAGADPEQTDEVMLVRSRVSRILFGRKFYDYPIKFAPRTFANLGIGRSLTIFASYGRARLFPIKPELTLEDFVINRFGKTLYETFFEKYTEKVWGVPCAEIPADWGAQRIKGVSISGLIRHALGKLKPRRASISQKEVETSLIERFLYPKHGPGQLWETVARNITDAGGELHFNTRVVGVNHDGGRITSVEIERDGKRETIAGDMVFSSMPIQELISGWMPAAPASVRAVSDGLTYRDFITVGVLLKQVTLGQGAQAHNLAERLPDNWIYVQESDVKVGRLQLFNNWSPYLVADPATIWMGLEYFVNEADEFWQTDDTKIIEFATKELKQLGVSQPEDLLDAVVVRTKKAYPAYFGSYDKFDQIQNYVMQFENLYCVGRNGMHRYNNQDHSILTAMVAVDGIAQGRDLRRAMWDVNTEQDYHEGK
ncbi:NAD(P)/FAD-dependent oxidoreductase [Roseovarius sp.]|uniref:NAD(P)/FAD-dependent oxidoreductase n=1 Tax=Roseovarius sp. TaxID=1486281 RepID=UPI00262CC005|nr:NAD(P)/FAD-dependent oxidoreductase [Roseovarius sp.]